MPLRHCFVHGRYARLNVGEEGAWCGLADRHEMRFRRTFKECGKYCGFDCVAHAHSGRSCQSLGQRDTQKCQDQIVVPTVTIGISWPPAVVLIWISTDRETEERPEDRFRSEAVTNDRPSWKMPSSRAPHFTALEYHVFYQK